MTGDRYRTLTAAAVLLVALIAAVVSYLHIARLALEYGQEPLAAYLLPLSIDGLVLTSSLVMLRSARSGVSTPWLARAGLVLAVAATLAANVASGLSHGWPGAVLAGWPAVAFILSAEIAISMSRTRPQKVRATDSKPAPAAWSGRPDPTTAPAKKAAPKPRQSRASMADVEASALAVMARQPGVSGAELGRAIGASPRTGQRLLSRLSDRDKVAT